MTEPTRFSELEAAIDRVAASYTGELEIDNLDSAALPNEREVVAAFEDLKPALFIGFFATRSVTRHSLRFSIAEHIYRSYESFVTQIARAQSYDAWPPTDRRPAPRAQDAEEVALELMRRLPELRRQLEGDAQAAFAGDPSARSIEEVIFSYPSIQAVTAYRVAHELRRLGVRMLPRIIAEHAHKRTGIDINPGATIGERFFLGHGTGVVIGETSVIGSDVKIYQHVTLGALSIPQRDEDTTVQRHPTLEDGVTVYAGATILGGDTVIGKGSVIGGNVWLVHSVPPNSRIFGGVAPAER